MMRIGLEGKAAPPCAEARVNRAGVARTPVEAARMRRRVGFKLLPRLRFGGTLGQRVRCGQAKLGHMLAEMPMKLPAGLFIEAEGEMTVGVGGEARLDGAGGGAVLGEAGVLDEIFKTSASWRADDRGAAEDGKGASRCAYGERPIAGLPCSSYGSGHGRRG